MGKTAFVLSMARNMAVAHGKTVAFFSLEMSSIQLVNRLIAAEIEVGSDKLRNGTLSDSEWQCLETKLHGSLCQIRINHLCLLTARLRQSTAAAAAGLWKNSVSKKVARRYSSALFINRPFIFHIG